MAETTAISWADRTWSPWYGCTQVSLGERGACVGCYARFISETRQGRVVFGGPGRGEGTRDARADSAWKDPLRWEREVAALARAWHAGPNGGMGRPYPYSPFVFPSMCDPFDNHPALPELRRRFFDLIRATPHLTWLLLTKRPGNIVKLFTEALSEADKFMLVDPPLTSLADCWPRNAAIGFTAVTQEEFDRDWPKARDAFLSLGAPFIFWSGEPLMSGIILPDDFLALGARAWAIPGGETNQGAHRGRPSHPDWFRSLRDQCATAGVPFHFKQWGEFREFDTGSSEVEVVEAGDDFAESIWAAAERPALLSKDGREFRHPDLIPEGLDCRLLERVGKKAAGRTLDGVIHDARPEVAL